MTVLTAIAFATAYTQNIYDGKTVNQDDTYISDNCDMTDMEDMQQSAYTSNYNTSGLRNILLVNTQDDSLHLPALTSRGQVMPTSMYPAGWYGWHNWELHKGLNLNIGTSVFAQFGKNARHGAGFSQNISAVYAVPITGKLSVAAGGYLNNIYWSHDEYKDAGLSAILGYKFNERWEAYLYGQKSIVNNQRMPYSLYDMNALGDRIGAALKYNFNNNSSIQISIESCSAPKSKTAFHIHSPVTEQRP